MGEAALGRLHQIGNIRIVVYGDDHLPPHFHAVGPDFEAFVVIETLEIIRGALAPRARREVLDWAAANRAALAAEWNRINPRFAIARGDRRD